MFVPTQIKLLIAGAGVVALFSAAWLLYEEGKKVGRQQVTIEWNKDREVQAENTRSYLEEVNSTARKELDDARKREANLRKDVVAAHGAVSGLRKQLQQANERISVASAEAVADYARTVSELFQDCTDAYRDMAEKADGHASDAVLQYKFFAPSSTGEAH